MLSAHNSRPAGTRTERDEVPSATATRCGQPGQVGRVLALQRIAGNRAVTRVLQRDPAPGSGTTDAPTAAEVGPADFDSIVEDYPIFPAQVDSLGREIEYTPPNIYAGETRIKYRDVSVRRLTKAGLRAHLTTLEHGPLSPFEEQLVAGWPQDPDAALRVLLRIGHSGIFGYVLVTGGSGDRLHRVYARDGTLVHEHHS